MVHKIKLALRCLVWLAAASPALQLHASNQLQMDLPKSRNTADAQSSSGRQLLQGDPAAGTPTTVGCVEDPSAAPFNAIGRLLDPADRFLAMGTLIAPDAVFTCAKCLDKDQKAKFVVGGSRCSGQTGPPTTSDVVSVFKPSGPSSSLYTVAKLSRNFTHYLPLVADNVKREPSISFASWTGDCFGFPPWLQMLVLHMHSITECVVRCCMPCAPVCLLHCRLPEPDTWMRQNESLLKGHGRHALHSSRHAPLQQCTTTS